jgi:hypothetical protein
MAGSLLVDVGQLPILERLIEGSLTDKRGDCNV